MRYLSNIFLLVFVLGCTKQKQELPIIDVDVNKIEEYDLSEICDSVTAIPLETNPNCIISIVRKVKFSNTHIYVAGKQRILKFDYRGNFIRQVNKVGRGPGELHTFTDFYVSKNDDTLDILTFKKILRYDSSGNLLKEIPLKNINGLPEQIYRCDSNIWITKSKLLQNGNNGQNTIVKMLKINEKSMITDSLRILQADNSARFSYMNPAAVYYSSTDMHSFFYYPHHIIEPVVRDTVFIFDNNDLLPAYKLNFGKKLSKNVASQKVISGVPPYKYFRINSIFLTSHYIFSSYSIEDNEYFFCYNLQKRVKHIMKNGYNDNFYHTGKVMPKQFNYSTNKLFFVKNGFELAGNIDNVNENSNPVIFLLHL